MKYFCKARTIAEQQEKNIIFLLRYRNKYALRLVIPCVCRSCPSPTLSIDEPEPRFWTIEINTRFL